MQYPLSSLDESPPRENRSPHMATATNTLFASSRSARSLGLAVAASILFLATIGGSSALYSAYTGPMAQQAAVVQPAA